MKRTRRNHASGFKIKTAIATIKKPLPGGFTQRNPFRHRLAKFGCYAGLQFCFESDSGWR